MREPSISPSDAIIEEDAPGDDGRFGHQPEDGHGFEKFVEVHLGGEGEGEGVP